MFLPLKILEERFREILAEDIGMGDITTASIVPLGTIVEAEVIPKEAGVAAGVEEASVFLESLGLDVKTLVTDGEKIQVKKAIIKVSGDARTLLSAERTLLNVLSRMSGIATATRNIVEKLRHAGRETKVACTRKTAPGLLYFDKKAVLAGGGETHRLHLDDMILIKDNHIEIVGSVEKAVKIARESASPSKKVEVEVTKLGDVLLAIKAGADIVMLDNFSPKQIEKAMTLLKRNKLRGKVLVEASGGITGDNVLEFASTGVDLVSLGELTHSAKALNMSLEITGVKRPHASKPP
jgi:nicotinate-nucleotide pyrophosphorylase (carboxylating)